MKRLRSAMTTTVSGAVLYWVPSLAWGIAASCVLITVTVCTLLICAFFGQQGDRRDWLISLIEALRKGS